MRIAFLSVRPPYPANTGGRIRTFHLLKELCHGHDVTLVTAVQGESDSVALDRLRRVIPRVHVKSVAIDTESPMERIARAARNPVDPLPFTWARYRQPRFAALVAGVLGGGGYDVVHCDHVQVAHVLEGLRTPPRLLNAHNVESVLVRRVGDHAGAWWRRLAIAWQAAKTLNAERRAFHLFDRCLAVSEDDAADIRRMAPGVPVSLVPNGVDIEHFAPQREPGAPLEMAFTGAMDWLPNVDGVTFFVREILPLIRQRLPGARLCVIGRNPSEGLVRRLADEAVRFTGNVEDVRPYVARARVVVVPLRIGGGTRLKILEAWALAKPVVSTSLGAEGLPARDGENIAIADAPEAFAERTVALLNDTVSGGELGAAGRRTAEERYAWPRIARDLVEAYEATIAGLSGMGSRSTCSAPRSGSSLAAPRRSAGTGW